MSMENPDDLLARATRAMRDTTTPRVEAEEEGESVHEGVPATTLARVERSTRARRVTKLRQRRYTRWLVMPMAASFIVFCAWASASGRLSQWVSSRSHAEEERAGYAPPPPPPASSPPPLPPPLPAPPPVPAESVEPKIDEEPLRKPVLAPTKPAPAPSVDVDALYRDAHDAHFVRRDPAAALAGWDRYLAAAGPSGRFTLDAR
jgi:hypothetical protein